MSDALSKPTVDELADALDEVVSAVVKHRMNARRVDDTFDLISAAQLCATSEDTWAACSWVRDPVGRALRNGVRDIGRHIIEGTGTRALEAVLEAVAKRDERNYGHRAGIMDHAFDGLGVGNDVWHC